MDLKDNNQSKTESNDSSKDEDKIDVKNGKNYTIMIYMIGSNLESESMAASKDIMEIMDSGIDVEKNNVILYTGGSKCWYVSIDANKNSTYKLNENREMQLVNSTESKNMADGDTLKEFVDYCYDNYKANHYGLICWDHGAGPIGGFGNDELYDYDSMYSVEMKNAFETSEFCKDRKFDFIGFDACLMSSIEYADMLSNYSDYLVASQETEPGTGWNYSFLKKLNSESNPEIIGKEIVDKYIESCNDSESYVQPELTMACLNLKKVNEVVNSMNALLGKMSLELDNDKYEDVAATRYSVKEYGLTATGGKGNSLDLVDLGDLATKMSGQYPDESKELNEKISDMIVYKDGNVEDSCGVSMYYPYNNKEYFNNIGQYLYDKASSSNIYKKYINKFVESTNDSISSVVDTNSNYKDDGESIRFKLTKKQMKNAKNVSYTLLEKRDNEYVPLVANVKANVNRDGTVYISKKQKYFFIESENGLESYIWKVKLISDNGKNKIWQTVDTRTEDYNNMYGFGDLNGEVEDIVISFKENQDGKIIINNISQNSSEGVLNGKENIDLNKWYNLYYFLSPVKLTKNKSGKTLPYTKWEKSGAALGIPGINIEDGLRIVKKSLSGSVGHGDIYCQLTVESNNGNVQGTNIKKIENKSTVESYTEEQGQSKITYKIYDDHVEVVSIEGEEESIHLPEIVQELPLTVIESVSNSNIKEINIPEKVKIIKDGAFRDCPIKKIDLPEGLESIGNNAFEGTRINKIKLPKTVKDIKGGALNYPIMNIEVDSENEYYTVKDNVLFTKDMKKLVCYPWKEITYNNKSKVETFSYEIPEGVEEIGNEAFACEQLSEVKFPNTLKKIGSMAFSSCSFMKILNLPDSLETIGSAAFNGAFRHNEISIHIGAGVNYIGREAFGNNYINEFSVSEKNQYYSTKDGSLTNKKQDVLLFSKTKNGKVFIVPDGIKTIWKTAFDSLTEKYSDVDCVEKIVIPDSVECINYWVDLSCKDWTIGKKLKYWDAAYRIDDYISSYGDKYNIKISKENPYYVIKDGKIKYKKKTFRKKNAKERAGKKK